MQVTLPQTPRPLLPVMEISAVDQAYLRYRLDYERQRHAQALKLRRQLIRQRRCFQSRLEQALSPSLLQELDVQVVLDTQYLQRPGFIGNFEDSGTQWILRFQGDFLGGRWYFRDSHSSKLYACSPRQLETQLCYALGQDRMQSCLLAHA